MSKVTSHQTNSYLVLGVSVVAARRGARRRVQHVLETNVSRRQHVSQNRHLPILLKLSQIGVRQRLDGGHDSLERPLEASAENTVVGLGTQMHAVLRSVARNRHTPHIELLEMTATITTVNNKIQHFYSVIFTECSIALHITCF